MPIRDVLLVLLSYPEPTPSWAIEAAAALARRHGARLSAALSVSTIPAISNILADRLVGANEAIAEESRKSRADADALAADFQRIAGALAGDVLRISCGHIIDPRPTAEHARLYDLTLVPAYGHPETNPLIETLVFASGRPVVLLPESRAQTGPGKVVIGWDGGRPAARAMADALPLCRVAGSVEIVAVTGEKKLPDSLSLDKASEHLERHGITATTLALPAEGLDAGSALLRHCRAAAADLLVMGAYGQSRLREFVLGGATRTVLAAPALAVLMSH